jgi:hypothetical protein
VVAVKPKLTKADPEGRTGCKRESQHDQGRSIVIKLDCRNMTTPQFAEQIRALDLHISYLVTDEPRRHSRVQRGPTAHFRSRPRE